MTSIAQRVSALVGISPQACWRIANSAHLRYKLYSIPKRRGHGVRVVAQPSREVKALQRALVEILAPVLPVHPAATAYVKGSSILKNAEAHASSRFLTKLDFSSFFPSIDERALAEHLRAHIAAVSEEDVRFVLSVCLWRHEGRRCLCIGAPSSPLLSNSVMYEFDSRATAVCEPLCVTYTRYSDDISLSCEQPEVLQLAESMIIDVCTQIAYPSLVFNAEKRVAVGRGAAMRVTGLTLSNSGQVTVGRARKRGVRAGAHRYALGLLTLEQAASLKGEIAFVLSVEPGFRSVLESAYGAAVEPLLPKSEG